VSDHPTVRCAIYTRKSTDEGLDQDFNSLDAQREAAELYVASQKNEGWVALTDRYDDGGYSGGDMDRPALRHLLADVKDGKVDCLVVYKVDRLSRSLLDFARIMETLDTHGVSFVSVTQQFNTTHSMGRLTLNILLSFAQFEREIIAERTSDKMQAARRKGKWTGGRPILGYDVAPEGGRLLVNEDEAARVRAIFDLYLETGSLLPTVKEMHRRGWTNKRWVTKKGRVCGGKPFGKPALQRLLSNVTYLGKVRSGDQFVDGEHDAVVEEGVWRRVQRLLARNSRSGGRHVRNRYGALLKGLIRCAPCGCAMVHAYTRRGNHQYRYYVCSKAQKHGWATCPTKSVPAAEIERFVLDELRRAGEDPEVLAQTLRETGRQVEKGLQTLRSEARGLKRELAGYNQEMRRLAASGGNGEVTARLADLQDRIRTAERRATEVREEMAALERERVDEEDLARALQAFDPVWEGLAPRDQCRLVRLLVQEVACDGTQGTVALTFRPTGIKTLAEEQAREEVVV
jgi:site-specific DNA recombinase